MIARQKAPQQPRRVWQRMLSGRRLDLVDPSPLDIEIEDIAHGLARVARWNGQTVGDHAFSVAQHSLLVVDIVEALNPASIDRRVLLAALLHDAPEYVIGDMITPFKAILGEGYRDIETNLARAIHIRHSLPAVLPQKWLNLIKSADRVSAFLEATQLAGFERAEAVRFFGEPQTSLARIQIKPLPPTDVEAAFLKRHNALFDERQRERDLGEVAVIKQTYDSL
ncbi:MAG: HD family hydrolase [Pseudomonadota bacterium]